MGWLTAQHPPKMSGEEKLYYQVNHNVFLAHAEAVLAFCRERLAHFKCPRRVELVDALPRTATGKLQKFKLRDAWWTGDRRVQ